MNVEQCTRPEYSIDGITGEEMDTMRAIHLQIDPQKLSNRGKMFIR